MPTTALTQTPSAGCESGPLWLAAWPVEKVNTEDGWKVTIFVEGHGGDCLYTYSWEGQVVSEPISGSLTFEVSQTDPHAVIFGTASVASAGEVDEVGLFIKPPGED
jgi:hypothetical protein